MSLRSKIVEREDELFIVQNIVKSLEVSEEKVMAKHDFFAVLRDYIAVYFTAWLRSDRFDFRRINEWKISRFS